MKIENKINKGRMIVFLISYLLSRLVFKIENFNYSLSEELFNIHFIIDFGTWALIYMLVSFVLSHIKNKAQK